jgi:hypothetical protein
VQSKYLKRQIREENKMDSMERFFDAMHQLEFGIRTLKKPHVEYYTRSGIKAVYLAVIFLIAFIFFLFLYFCT